MSQQPLPTEVEHPLLKANLRYYSVKEVADILDTSERSVYRHVGEGRIKAVQSPYNRRGLKIPRSEVLRLVEMMSVPVADAEGSV